MKIALVHISDFHIKSRDIFLREKIDSWLSALNVLGKVDDYIIIFTGDLANSGQINEYKNARHLIIKLIKGIKEKNNNKFVKTYIIPGNHDLNFPENVRDQKQIQRCYDERNIDKALEKEFCYLDNFFKFNLSTRFSDRLFKKEILTFDNYKIQLNLINTAPFSMLEPNDKELHYFPHEKIELLKKRSDVNLCITAMHHSSEWFNWEYKSHLEKTIINNSEVLLIGHDHREHTENVAIDSSMYTWISDAGTMNFSSFDSQDAFNVMVVNTECDSFDGYTFTWSSKSKLFIDKKTAKNKMLQNRSTRITPHSDFLQSLKEDSYNPCKDFTQYFVFPKLKSDSKNEFGNYEEIKSFDEFEKVLNQKKKILITGNTDSGKTSLLKYIYCNILSKKTPLLIIVDNKTRLKPNNFIKHYFEEQYGEEPELFTKFNQLNKSERILLIDGWDILHDSPLKNQVLDIIEGEFEYIIFSSHPYQKDVVESIFLGLTTEKYFSEYRIKPFYSEKRTELVRNICNQKNSFLSDQDIDNLNKLIDMLVQNNAGLFSLNPSFIIKYTNYLLEVPYQDYAKGEAIFSKIFEFELNQSIIKLSSKSDADEIFTTFEEIAGNMFCMEKDVLSIEEIKKIVDNYNTLFGVSVKTKMIIDIGLKSKILSQTDDMEIYFTNRNHLSYFVAKYLIRYAQGNPDDRQSVEFAMDKISYAMKNICFGINSDIILFISYLLNNTQTIMLIAQHANELLSSIPEVSLSQNNISILRGTNSLHINPPSSEDKKNYDKYKEKREETIYSEDTLEAKGLFSYNVEDIDKYQYRIIRSIKYTEMICKALPSFNSTLKLVQKNSLVDSIYSYPRKIVYALLRPIELDLDIIIDELLNMINEWNIHKKNGGTYKKEDIQSMIKNYAQATLVGFFDHFSELCVSQKTVDLLSEHQTADITEEIEKLLIIENFGNFELLLKNSEKLIKRNKDIDIQNMVQMIVRKYLLCNPNLTFSQKQQMIDKVFGNESRKTFMFPNKK